MSVQFPAGGSPPADLAHPPDAGADLASEVAGTQLDKSIDVPLALIANDAYNAPGAVDNPQNHAALEAAGWTRLEASGDHLVDDAGNRIDIDPALLEDDGSGFRASIYRNDQGQFVVGFAGTDPSQFGDLVTDGGQGIGVETEQYRRAAAVAQQVQDQVGDGNVAFTGHSLGGGLASAAALATHETGVTFNAAGLSNETIRDLGFDNPNEVREQYESNGALRRYSVAGDPLTAATAAGAPDALGTPWSIPAGDAAASDFLELHGGGGDHAIYVDGLRDATPTPGIVGNPIVDKIDAFTDIVGPAIPGPLGIVIGSNANERNTALNVLGAATQGIVDLGGDAGRIGGDLLGDLAQVYGQAQPLDNWRAGGVVADSVLDELGSVANRGTEVAGGTVTSLTDGAGSALRDVADSTGLGIFDDAARAVERGGNAVDDGLEAVGNGFETATDWVGDKVERGTDVVAGAGEAVGDWVGDAVATGAGWVANAGAAAGRALDPRNWF